MIKGKWTKKLCSNTGETIGETLVALLISSLALLMLAGAITAATRVVDRSKTAIADYYVADNVLASFPTDPTPETISITIGDDDISQPFDGVNYYQNNKLGGIDVISYKKPD